MLDYCFLKVRWIRMVALSQYDGSNHAAIHLLKNLARQVRSRGSIPMATEDFFFHFDPHSCANHRALPARTIVEQVRFGETGGEMAVRAHDEDIVDLRTTRIPSDFVLSQQEFEN
jgi:hypothetical protein